MPDARDLPNPLSEEELKQLVREILRGQYLDVEMVLDTGLANIVMVFPQLALGAMTGYSKEQVSQLTMYGLLKDAGPVAINGLPIFFQARLMLASDREKLIDMYKKARQAIEEVLSD